MAKNIEVATPGTPRMGELTTVHLVSGRNNFKQVTSSLIRQIKQSHIHLSKNLPEVHKVEKILLDVDISQLDEG